MAGSYEGKGEDGKERFKDGPDGPIIVKDPSKKGKDAWSYEEDRSGGGGGNSGCLSSIIGFIMFTTGIMAFIIHSI